MEKMEQNTLINELLQGMEVAKQLRYHMTSASSPETRELLVQRLLTSYETALLILNWSEAPRTLPESPLSINGSPWNENSEEGLKDHQEHKHVSKKRKSMPTWTDQVRINSENGLEGPHEDGYNWRKYGQKDILGAKYPRSYYRCTFRNSQNCYATKQVQRSEDDPSVFDITYRAKHTCTHANQSNPAPASPAKQEKKPNNHQQEAIFNFRTNLRVNTDMDNKETESPYPFTATTFGTKESENNVVSGCYSPSFLSPSTPETDYFCIFGGDENFRSSASDLSEILSANTSATNSPSMKLDFSFDNVEINPYIPFDIPGFLSY